MNLFFLVLGLSVGSFLNMAIYRTAKAYKIPNFKKQFPNKLQITKNKFQNKDRSYCDYCGRQLCWYENVPVLSWLIQRGKTRCCGNPLPWEYPVIEILTGIIFILISNLQFQISNEFIIFNLLINLIVVALLMFSLVFDLKYMILPDFANYSLIVISLILILGGYGNSSVQNIYVGLGSILFFFVLNRIKIRGSEAMGMGDVKYSLFMGLFLGWPNIVVAIYFAFVIGALLSIILLFFKIVKKENPIPFGPFLIVGTVIAKIWGDQLIKYFFGVLF